MSSRCALTPSLPLTHAHLHSSPFALIHLQKAKEKALRAAHFSKSKFSGTLVWDLVPRGRTRWLLACLSQQGQLQQHRKTLPT